MSTTTTKRRRTPTREDATVRASRALYEAQARRTFLFLDIPYFLDDKRPRGTTLWQAALFLPLVRSRLNSAGLLAKTGPQVVVLVYRNDGALVAAVDVPAGPTLWNAFDIIAPGRLGGPGAQIVVYVRGDGANLNLEPVTRRLLGEVLRVAELAGVTVADIVMVNHRHEGWSLAESGVLATLRGGLR